MSIVKIVCDDKVFRTCKNKLRKYVNLDDLANNDICKKLEDNCYLIDVDPSAVQYIVDKARGYNCRILNDKTAIGLEQLGYSESALEGGSYDNSQIDEIFKKLNISGTGNPIKDLDDPAIEQAINNYNLKLDNESTTEQPFNKHLSEELRNLQKGGSDKKLIFNKKGCFDFFNKKKFYL
jgi:hypothetical protein